MMKEFSQEQIDAVDLGRNHLWPGGAVFICMGKMLCPYLDELSKAEPCPVCYPVEYGDPRPTRQILESLQNAYS